MTFTDASYAACREHAAEALDAMDGAVIRVMRVTGHDRGPGAALYTCHCGKPADFHLMEVAKQP